MKKSTYIGLFALVITLISFSTGTKVNAAQDIEGRLYNTWLQMSDNTLFNGKARNFEKGKQSIEISFDQWNSSICTSASDSSLLTINLFDPALNRAVSYKTVSTHLYTCSRANFGTFGKGKYSHYFLTFSGNQEKFCGFKSNSVIMKSEA